MPHTPRAARFEAVYMAPVPLEKSHPGRGGKEILARWRLGA